MASGNFQTNVGSHWYLRGEWSSSTNVNNNTSSVNVKLYWGGAYAINSSARKTAGITIDGTQNTTNVPNAGISNGQKKLIHEYTRTVSHNSDGRKSINLSAYFNAEVTLSGRYFGRVNTSGTARLDDIPRASSPSSSANWTAPNNLNVSINRASNSFRHTVYIDVQDSSNNWHNVASRENVAGSVNFNFSTGELQNIFNRINGRNSARSRINVHTFNGSTRVGTTQGTEGTVSTADSSTISFGNNVNIGNAISGSVNQRHSSYHTTIQLIAGGTRNAHTTGTGGSWSYNTSGIASTLYNATPNSNTLSGTLRVTTRINNGSGAVVRSARDYNITLRVTGSNPTFAGNFTYADTNSTATSITGNNQMIIQNVSTPRITIASGNRATPNNGATISRYVVTAGGARREANWSTSNVTVDLGTVNVSSNTNLTVQAIDSRGNSTSRTISMSILSYSSPRIRANAIRRNNFENETVLRVRGSLSGLRVGSSDRNSIQSLRWRFREETASTWGGWQNFSGINSTATDFSAQPDTLNLDNTKGFDIQIEARDRLNTTTVTLNVEKGRPIFFIDETLGSVGFGDVPTAPDQVAINGQLSFASNMWASRGATGAIDMNNSDIVRANGIYFNDRHNTLPTGAASGSIHNGEGLMFLKPGFPDGSENQNHYESFGVWDGVGYLDNEPMFARMEVLWSGAMYMTANHTIYPSKRIDQCPNGWCLLFSRYDPSAGAPNNDNWSMQFIHKRQTTATGGGGTNVIAFTGGTRDDPTIVVKYLYFSTADRITGHSSNNFSGNGNNQVVLREVISF